VHGVLLLLLLLLLGMMLCRMLRGCWRRLLTRCRRGRTRSTKLTLPSTRLGITRCHTLCTRRRSLLLRPFIRRGRGNPLLLLLSIVIIEIPWSHVILALTARTIDIISISALTLTSVVLLVVARESGKVLGLGEAWCCGWGGGGLVPLCLAGDEVSKSSGGLIRLGGYLGGSLGRGDSLGLGVGGLRLCDSGGGALL
jgi:hypothetical protein